MKGRAARFKSINRKMIKTGEDRYINLCHYHRRQHLKCITGIIMRALLFIQLHSLCTVCHIVSFYASKYLLFRCPYLCRLQALCSFQKPSSQPVPRSCEVTHLGKMHVRYPNTNCSQAVISLSFFGNHYQSQFQHPPSDDFISIPCVQGPERQSNLDALQLIISM